MVGEGGAGQGTLAAPVWSWIQSLSGPGSRFGILHDQDHPPTQARRQPGRARTGPARFVPPGLVLPGRGRPGPTSLRPAGPLSKKLFTLFDLCVSSLRRGHANLLCIVPILADDLRRESDSVDSVVTKNLMVIKRETRDVRTFAGGHTVSNAPDLFRPPKLSGTGPG